MYIFIPLKTVHFQAVIDIRGVFNNYEYEKGG